MLLTQSFELFAQKGYEAITMREIASALGVTTGTLYHYFPNKKALFEQLVELLCEWDIELYSSSLDAESSIESRIAKAFELVEQNEDFYLKILFVIVDFYRQQRNEGVTDNRFLEALAARWQAECAELTGIHDTQLVTFLMCFLNGLLVERLFEGDKVSYREQSELFRSMFLDRLKVTQANL